ncbi:MAG: HPr family phosphocarrier protein [Syntrophobacterales bacterium]|jgi:phosphocarrier protein|nr:HPr family phosphocarrier protein [Syntrophobacterales bacterium]
MREGTFSIKNRLGLHARASAIFVKKATEFTSDVWMEKDGKKVNGKSMMDLLMLACPLGSTIRLSTDGSDEDDAFRELGVLINEGFYEE